MADDNILAGIGGFAEGFKDVLVPFIQTRYKSDLDRRNAIAQLEATKKAEFELYKNKLPFERDQDTFRSGLKQSEDINRIETEVKNRPYKKIYDQKGNLIGRSQDDVTQLKGVSKILIPKSKFLERQASGEVLNSDEYQVVDDTSAQKAGGEEGTLDSLMDSLERIKTARMQMQGSSRALASIPGGTVVGKFGSAGISAWDSEKKLFSQRLGKFAERSRMSDKDRDFYLSLINAPASTDAAFNANMATVKTALSEWNGKANQNSPITPYSGNPSNSQYKVGDSIEGKKIVAVRVKKRGN